MLSLQRNILNHFFLGKLPDADIKAPHTYRQFYQAFLQAYPDAATHRQAEHFLQQQLGWAARQSCDLPENPDDLHQWLQQHTERTGYAYQQYLKSRQQGAPRRFFANKSEALLFLQRVEPTKRVDGSWLYGTLHSWHDAGCAHLIRTYLDELGNGLSAQNHVLLFQQLLAKEGISVSNNLPDEYYHQGCIQLALGLLGQEYLPEVIGFNLGYEQMPLHLLITTYELDELGIDPYYFSLHVTVDNAHNGHAQQAVEAVFAMLPLFKDRDEFYQRIRRGYLLNNLGACTEQIIKEIDLKQAVVEVFRDKAVVGQFAHGNYCRMGGRTINEWLSNTDDIERFIDFMQEAGWVKRHENPENSRFWQLIRGEKAVMYGVFSQAEQQIMYDWIAGKWLSSPGAPRPRRYRAVHRHVTDVMPSQTLSVQQALNSKNTDLAHLAQKLVERDTSEQAFYLLAPYLSPALHTSPVGLWATQQFLKLFDQEASMPMQS
ncbi:iron-containing redox enzyme family protein [Alkanindiges sp. WGS2144]|uniref:iron-containing redox enzyme family protein n=1 Tax=Alkanindiges sp. WGS2144 TaxID=3366808 RepID=UPI00375231C0